MALVQNLTVHLTRAVADAMKADAEPIIQEALKNIEQKLRISIEADIVKLVSSLEFTPTATGVTISFSKTY